MTSIKALNKPGIEGLHCLIIIFIYKGSIPKVILSGKKIKIMFYKIKNKTKVTTPITSI